MIKKYLSTLTIIFILVVSVCACGESITYAGKYSNGKFYIELRSDGTFNAENFVKFSGKYTVKGENVEFTVTKMNEKNIKNVAKGTLIGNKLKGPDGFEYEKNVAK